MTGVIIKSTGSWYWVRTATHEQFQCRIRGKFRIKGIKSTSPLTVGDHVDFELEMSTNSGIITKIHDRKNYIVRKSVNLSKQTHIIVANIDLAFLLVTLDNPPTFTSFIDRFLATAEAYHIKAILLFNKVDLYDEALNHKKNELIRIYENIGYTCLEISATENINIKKVSELMLGKISMFSGHSGVGKSTLINAIDPSLQLKTAEISIQHKQGQHTTTFAEMHPLTFGGHIIDSPGIKMLSFINMEPANVSHYFREIFKHSSDCKYSNCMHVNEPKCAVKAAVETGEISELRYLNYTSILQDIKEQNHWERNMEL